jgi:hypothetical protein
MQLEQALVQQVRQTLVAAEVVDIHQAVEPVVLELSFFVTLLVLLAHQQLLQLQALQTS